MNTFNTYLYVTELSVLLQFYLYLYSVPTANGVLIVFDKIFK